MADRHIIRRIVIALSVVLLAGCVSQVAIPPEVERREPAEFDGAHYKALLAQGKPVFRIDPDRSLVVIEVRRAGSLARLGHDHVVASHHAAGSIAPQEGRADLWVPLDALVVDEPLLRTEAGFDTQPSADDIAGTRRNMLQRVLETGLHPYALIAVKDIGAEGGAQKLRLAMTLHGTTRSVDTEAKVEKTADEISVTGAFAIDQSRFGITPLSILGGAIAVQDRVNIAFRIHAHRIERPRVGG